MRRRVRASDTNQTIAFTNLWVGTVFQEGRCATSCSARRVYSDSFADMADSPSELCHELGLEAQFELARERSCVGLYFAPVPEISDSMVWYEWFSSSEPSVRLEGDADPEDWRIYGAAKRALHAAASLETRYGMRNRVTCRYIGLADTSSSEADALAPFVTWNQLGARRPRQSKQLVFRWTMALGRRVLKESTKVNIEAALQWPSLPSAYPASVTKTLLELDWAWDDDALDKAMQAWPDIAHKPSHHHYGSCVPVPAGWDALLRQHCSNAVSLERQLEAAAQEAEARFQNSAERPDDWKCTCSYLGVAVCADVFEKDPIHWPAEDCDMTKRVVTFRWELHVPGRNVLCDVTSRRCLDVLQRGLPKPPAQLTFFVSWQRTREQVEGNAKRQAMQYFPEDDRVSCHILGMPWPHQPEAHRRWSNSSAHWRTHWPGDIVDIAGVEHMLAAHKYDTCQDSKWKAWNANDMWQKAASGSIKLEDFLDVDVHTQIQPPSKKRLRATAMLRGFAAARPYDTCSLISAARLFLQLDPVRRATCKRSRRDAWQEMTRCFDKDLMAWGATPDFRKQQIWVLWRWRQIFPVGPAVEEFFLSAANLDSILKNRTLAVPTELRDALTDHAEHGRMPRNRPRSQAAAAAAKFDAERIHAWSNRGVSRPRADESFAMLPCSRCGVPQFAELSDDDATDSNIQPDATYAMFVMCPTCCAI